MSVMLNSIELWLHLTLTVDLDIYLHISDKRKLPTTGKPVRI